MVKDAMNGYLVKEGDIVAFADRVCELIENEEFRQKMSQNAKLSSKRYEAEVIMPLWIQLLNQLIMGEQQISSESNGS